MKRIILSSAAVLLVALSSIAQEPNTSTCEKKCTKKECSKGKCKDKTCEKCGEKCTASSCDSKNKKCKSECNTPQTTTH